MRIRNLSFTLILILSASLLFLASCHRGEKSERAFEKTFREGEIEYSFKTQKKELDIMNLPWFMPSKVTLYFKSPYVKAVATEGAIMTMVGLNIRLTFLLDTESKAFVSQLTGAPTGSNFTKRLAINSTLDELMPRDSAGQAIPYDIFDTTYMDMECIGVRAKKREDTNKFLFIFAPTYGFKKLDQLYDTPGIAGIPLYVRLEDNESIVTVAATNVIPKELNDSIFTIQELPPEENMYDDRGNNQFMEAPQQ